MSTDTGTRTATAGSAAEDGPLLASRLVRWLEDGVRRDDLFTDDLFTDLSLPHWRIQGTGTDDAYRIRESGHPFPGTVRVARLEPTGTGFLLEFEERWHAEGQDWYCREMMHAVVTGGRIAELSVYCTGDWDEAVQRRHASEVTLARP